MRKNPDLPVQAGHNYGQPPQQEIGDALLATHMEIIRSSRVIGDAVDARKLEHIPSIVEELDPELVKIDHRRAVIDYIIEQLLVERGGAELDYAPLTMNVEFRHTDAEVAGVVMAGIVESYQEFLRETLQDVNSEAAELITEAKDELAADIRQLEEQYERFRLKTPMLTLGAGNLNKHQIRLGLLQTEMTRLELREAELRSRLEILAETSAGTRTSSFSELERLGLIDHRDVDRLSLLVSVERGDANSSEVFQAAQPTRSTMEEAEVERLLSLQSALREERRRLGENHPRVVDLQLAYKETKDFLDKKRNSVTGPEKVEPVRSGTLVAVYEKVLRKDLEDVGRQLDQVKKSIENEEQSAVLLVKDELKDDSLKEELVRTKTLQLAVIEWLRQRSMMSNHGSFITEVIRAPEIGEKTWPKLPIVLAAGLCLGLLFGGGSAIAVDLGDRSFRSSQEVEQVVGAPMLGAMMRLKFQPGDGTDKSVSPEVVVYHQPMSVAAEAYRHIRTSLMFRREGGPLRWIQVTSPNPGDGKTLTAANLAASMAQTGKRVLLIDADLRRPRVSTLFSLAHNSGLAEILRTEAEPMDLVRPTAIHRLSVLPSGSCKENPAELLQSATFTNLLQVYQDKFDLIFIDSPPILAVSEATSMSREVDGIVLCLRTANTPRPEAERAIRQLASVGTKPCGFVVNDIDRLVRKGDELEYSGDYYGKKHRQYYRAAKMS
jgi:capsular exopolysaccharide synthesis family protein